MKTITLKTEEEQRLDVALAQELNVSRNQVQKAVKAGLVLVDDEPATVKQLVSSQHTISYAPSFFAPKVKEEGPAPELHILYEDDDVVVLDKQAGVLVHETETSTEPTLTDALLEKYPGIEQVGEDPLRPGIVHRLDRSASGVLIVAKTADAFDHLKDQFKTRKTKKHYTVLVHGTMTHPEGVIDFPISRSKGRGRMAAKPNSQGGKIAKTYWDVVEQFPHHALLDVQIVTGRTHQIRAHMLAVGHPVVGDTLYRPKGFALLDIGRLFLHARELNITLPSGEKKSFVAPLPETLEQVLKDIPKL